MSYATLILGESGTGKTCSLRNLDHTKTLLIQPVRKPLPFRSAEWKEIKEKGDGGNIFVCANPQTIVEVMKRAPQDIIVIDDFQYILARLYMENEGGNQFDLFKSIGQSGYEIVKTASELAENKRVYVLGHTQRDDLGNVKIKTLGKLLDEKIVIEGLFTTVLRTKVSGGQYFFTTQNNGSDTVKSPLDMFPSNEIENDLATVDMTICQYYGLPVYLQAEDK